LQALNNESRRKLDRFLDFAKVCVLTTTSCSVVICRCSCRPSDTRLEAVAPALEAAGVCLNFARTGFIPTETMVARRKDSRYFPTQTSQPCSCVNGSICPKSTCWASERFGQDNASGDCGTAPAHHELGFRQIVLLAVGAAKTRVADCTSSLSVILDLFGAHVLTGTCFASNTLSGGFAGAINYNPLGADNIACTNWLRLHGTEGRIAFSTSSQVHRLSPSQTAPW
jgi:hypothetical protein